jgi:hypothetical protein
LPFIKQEVISVVASDKKFSPSFLFWRGAEQDVSLFKKIWLTYKETLIYHIFHIIMECHQGKSQSTHFASTLELLLGATSPKRMSLESRFHVGKELLHESTVPFRIRSMV